MRSIKVSESLEDFIIYYFQIKGYKFVTEESYFVDRCILRTKDRGYLAFLENANKDIVVLTPLKPEIIINNRVDLNNFLEAEGFKLKDFDLPFLSDDEYMINLKLFVLLPRKTEIMKTGSVFNMFRHMISSDFPMFYSEYVSCESPYQVIFASLMSMFLKSVSDVFVSSTYYKSLLAKARPRIKEFYKVSMQYLLSKRNESDFLWAIVSFCK